MTGLFLARVRCAFCGRLVHWRIHRRHEVECRKAMNLITWFIYCGEYPRRR